MVTFSFSSLAHRNHSVPLVRWRPLRRALIRVAEPACGGVCRNTQAGGSIVTMDRARGSDTRNSAKTRADRAIRASFRIGRSGENRNGNEPEDTPPVLPLADLQKIVGAHQPDEPGTSESAAGAAPGCRRYARCQTAARCRSPGCADAARSAAPPASAPRRARSRSHVFSGFCGVTIHHTSSRRSRFNASSEMWRCPS